MKTDKVIKPGQIVKAYIYGNTIELSSSNVNVNRQAILVIPNHKYVVLETGEIKSMNTDASSRVGNLSSVKRTMHNLRRLIANNFNGGMDQLWITLTFRTNVNAHHSHDTVTVYSDFKMFMQRLRKQIGRLEYISVIEPQLSGRWHLHVLMKTPDKKPLYIPNEVVQHCWKRGFTKTQRLSDTDNVAAYVMAYLTNLQVSDGDKKFNVKGARLWMYPKGLRIYRRSKGILNPKVVNTTKKKAIKSYNLTEEDRRATYERSFKTREGKTITTKTEYYNWKEGSK
ncbi:replicative protein [Limosilactobacillus reuteri]|uniref:rolling circle replication-associated protein n=1 Tax=Limosilactobacillus reuteri TaxID=1598 RepID=UPI0039960FA9